MTNAGKTFTVLGTDASPGLLPRAVADIVDAVAEANRQQLSPKAVSPTAASLADVLGELSDVQRTPLPALQPGESLSVTVSCLEIYNDQVFDALVTPPADPAIARPILKVKDGLGGRCGDSFGGGTGCLASRTAARLPEAEFYHLGAACHRCYCVTRDCAGCTSRA